VSNPVEKTNVQIRVRNAFGGEDIREIEAQSNRVNPIWELQSRGLLAIAIPPSITHAIADALKWVSLTGLIISTGMVTAAISPWMTITVLAAIALPVAALGYYLRTHCDDGQTFMNYRVILFLLGLALAIVGGF